MGTRAVEPEGVVRGDRRARSQGTSDPGRAVAGRRSVGGAEPQDTEAHGRHPVAGAGQRGDLRGGRCLGNVGVGKGGELEPRGDESARPEAGTRWVRDRLDERASQKTVTDHQRTPVVLRAVGAPDPGQALLIQQGRHGPVGITRPEPSPASRLGVGQPAA